MIQHRKITVIGRVQGVGFRYTALSVAQQLGIKGFVKNTQSNDVYIEAEGDEEQMKLFIDWCHEGTSHARVDNVIVYEGKLCNYEQFIISH